MPRWHGDLRKDLTFFQCSTQLSEGDWFIHGYKIFQISTPKSAISVLFSCLTPFSIDRVENPPPPHVQVHPPKILSISKYFKINYLSYHHDENFEIDFYFEIHSEITEIHVSAIINR